MGCVAEGVGVWGMGLMSDSEALEGLLVFGLSEQRAFAGNGTRGVMI